MPRRRLPPSRSGRRPSGRRSIAAACICLAAFPSEPATVDLAKLVRNNIFVYGIRGEGKSATHRAAALMKQKRFDASLIHTHTFSLEEVPTALKYSRERIDDAIKVVVKVDHPAIPNSVAA